MQTLTSPPPAAPSAPSIPSIPLPTEPRWAVRLARRLAERKVTAYSLSIASPACAVLAAGFLILGTHVHSGLGTVALILAALGIQLRFVCTLVGGIIAKERRDPTESREITEDLFDRAADVVILVAAGYAVAGSAMGPFVGWIAALLTIMTSYVHLLGDVVAIQSNEHGPMSKIHRMAVMTGACVAAALVPAEWRQAVMLLALAAVALGCAFNLWLKVPKLLRSFDLL